MTAKNQIIRLTAGDSRVVRFVITRPDGSPIDLTGATPILWVARSLSTPSADVAMKVTGTMDQVSVNGTLYARATFNLFQSDTSELEPRKYQHQMEIQTQSGQNYTVATGPFIVEPSLVL